MINKLVPRLLNGIAMLRTTEYRNFLLYRSDSLKKALPVPHHHPLSFFAPPPNQTNQSVSRPWARKRAAFGAASRRLAFEVRRRRRCRRRRCRTQGARNTFGPNFGSSSSGLPYSRPKRDGSGTDCRECNEVKLVSCGLCED